MRSNVQPSSNRADRKLNQPFVFNSFSRGTVKDPPAGKIRDCLADSLNLNIFPGYFEGRTGSLLYTETTFPALDGYTGLMAHKVGNRIVSDSGPIFTLEHVRCYFCFGDKFEFITEYINANEVVGSDSVYKESLNGYVIGSPNILDFHSTMKQWYLVLGRKFYTSDIEISNWDGILTVSRDEPYSSVCGYCEYKEKVIVFNGNGIYKIDLSASYPIAYRVNVDPPNIRIDSIIYDETIHRHRYRYLYSAMRIENDGGIVDRQTPGLIGLETGTNAADAENIDYAEVWTINEIDEDNPFLCETLWVPIIKNTSPVEYQWHFTHFPVYRTPDLEAIDPLDPDKSKYNDPSRAIWVKDLRICAAFYGYIIRDHLYLLRGELEIEDTGSIIETDSGERYEISEVISQVEAIVDGGNYQDIMVPPCAMAIGNGRVIRASVVGDELIRTHGSQFTVADERKTIWNSEGYRFYITDYINANRVRIHIDGGQPVQGFTMDPTHRNFYDITRDEILQARKDFYSCSVRYRSALPNCNMGGVMPGFIMCASRGTKDIFYSHLIDSMDYLIGQHVKIQRSDAIHDSIMAFWRFQDVFCIICANSTWGIAVGLSEFTTLPGSNEAIAIIPGIKQTVKGIGCLDWGSIKEVEGDMIELITNEQGQEALRYFNGYSYSTENHLVDESLGGRIVKALRKTKKVSQAIYDGLMGYILWRKNG